MNILGCLDRDWTGSYWLNGSDTTYWKESAEMLAAAIHFMRCLLYTSRCV